MADLLISYAWVERSRAMTLVATFRAAGHSVWIDDASDERGQLIGVPGGQDHWQVITAAIDAAGAFLVLSGADWEGSAYCRDEYVYARSVGKRIVVITDATVAAATAELDGVLGTVDVAELGELDGLLAAGDPAAAAHARLLTELADGGRRKRRISRGQVRDAEMLATTQLAGLGLAMAPGLSAYVDHALRTAVSRQRRLRAGAAVLVAVFVALAVVTVVARQSAEHDRAQARHQADYAGSLELAQEATQVEVTSQALALARRAVALDNNAATRAALQAAQADAYRSTAVVTPGGASGAAVSNDGRTALLVQGSTLLVVDAVAGRSATIDVEGGLKRRLALSPDGRTGFAVDGAGRMICVDVARRFVEPTPQTGIVDLQVTAEGQLWWLTTDATLYRSSGQGPAGCPVDNTTVVARGVNGVQAFAVSGTPTHLFTLTTQNVVEIHQLPVAGGKLGAPLRRITFADLPRDRLTSDDGAPDGSVPGSLTVCGDVVHVLAGVKYSLRASTHVALTYAGTPVGPRRTDTEMLGVGCAPQGMAWAAPLLDSAPAALPSSGIYPVGEVDSRDQSGLVTLADSPDGSRTVVAHGDGRVDVLTVDDLPWSRAVGDAEVAVPIDGGVVTVDAGGQTAFRSGTTVTQLGSIGATPLPDAPAAAHEAYVAAGTRVYGVSSSRIVGSVQLPGVAQSLRSTDGGDELIATGANWSAAVSADLDAPARRLTTPALPEAGGVVTVNLDGARQVVTTDHGLILLTDSSGQVLASRDTGVAGRLFAVVLPDHDVVVAGGDGVLRRYSADLRPLSAQRFGSSVVDLRVSPNGRTLLLALSGEYTVWAVDAASFQPIAEVATRSTDVRLVAPSPDGRTFVRLIPSGTNAAVDPAQLESFAVR